MAITTQPYWIFQQHFKEKTSPFGEKESILPLRQCTGSHVPSTDGQIQRIPLRIASPPAYFLFARFSLLRLFPNLKKWFGRKKFTIREQLIAERFILKGWTNHIIWTV